jgi:hypothetical protein
MAKTIQEQYNQINKGKGSKELFLKEVKRNYSNMIVNSATYKQAEEILLNRSVIVESLSGIVNPIKNPDWFKIFNSNMNIIKEETAASKKDEAIKAEIKEPNKDVVELETKGFDYKDQKNIDNLSGEQVRLGLKFEMDKVRETVSDADLGEAIEKAQKLVAKNLANDPLYYIKNAAFGVEGIGYTDEAPGLTASKSDQMEKVKLKENKMISLIDLMENGPLGEKASPKKPKVKKETLDSKLAEIDKQSSIVALEAKIQHVDEIIDKKNDRLSMVTEDESLSELVDKTKIKAMQREVKDLERRKIKMEKLYEKMCGKSYKKQEMVDEDLESTNYTSTGSDTSERAFRNNKNQDIAEESNAGSNENSNDNSNYSSNDNPESYSGLKKFRKN